MVDNRSMCVNWTSGGGYKTAGRRREISDEWRIIMANILNILNRVPDKKKQDDRQEQEERKKGFVLVRNVKWIMFAFFNCVALVFDGLAMTTVYTLTSGNLLLTALSLLPTGIPMFMWEGGWLYPLANKAQKTKSIIGVILSVVSALVVGTLAIVASLTTDAQTRFIVSVVLLVWCVVVVVIHGVLAALYFYKDPIILREHELQVTKADNDYQRETMRDAESLLKDATKMLEQEQEMKSKFGEAEVNRALEILLGIDLNGDGKIGNRPIKTSFASTSEQVNLQENQTKQNP
jgi:hypothetical protein